MNFNAQAESGEKSADPNWKLPGMGLPRDVGIRVLLIFTVLFLVKCGILWTLRKELFQTHWRVSSETFTPLNWVLFYGFAFLVGLNLWVFAARCANQLASTIRSAFGVVVAVGTVFIVLTFHEGDKNYVHPILHGVLRWTDLGWYFSLNLFFRAPFLAFWGVGLGVLYYILFRLGRERDVLRWVAIFAVAYLVLNLRELAQYRAGLAALNALGVACLCLGRRRSDTLKWTAAFGPWLLMGVGFMLFRPYDAIISRPSVDFMVVTGAGVALFIIASWMSRRGGFSDAWLTVVPFLSTSFLLLVTANYPFADNYRNLMFFGLTLPRYFCGEAGIALVLMLATVFFRRWRPAGSLWWLDGVGLICIVLALVDLRLTQIMGVRLDWQVVSFADSPKMIWRMAKPYLPVVTLGMTGIVVGYVIILRMLAKRRTAGSLTASLGPLTPRFAILTAILLGLAGLGMSKADKGEGEVLSSLVNTSPWWKRLTQPAYSPEKFIQSARDLGMKFIDVPTPQQISSPRVPRDLNVVFIFQESAYNSHLSLFGCTNNTQPMLAKYRDRMELFPHFFSNFAGSIYARFAALSGLYPTAEFREFTTEPVPSKTLFDILAERGYDTLVFDSCSVDYCSFRDFLKDHRAARVYDADSMPGQRKTEPVSWGLKEEETMGAILHELEARAQATNRFFLSYFPVAPHQPFDGVPERFKQFKQTKYRDFTPGYMNELLYLDWVITSIVDKLQETGLLEKTLVVITSDHGEMLGQNGGPIGHGWRITPELTNIPLIIMDPTHPHYDVNPVVGSQVDLLPTILDRLNLPLPQSELYQGTSLDRVVPNSSRLIYLNSFRQFAVIRGNKLFLGDRETGPEASLQAYAIAGHDEIPAFLPVTDTNRPAISMLEFDRFQQTLLRHYADYQKMLAPLHRQVSSMDLKEKSRADAALDRK